MPKNSRKIPLSYIELRLVGTDKNTPLISAETTFEVEETLLQKPTLVINNYTSLAPEKTPFCLIFNKPPPFYTV
ncbi:MAG: hypothetical protein ABGW76_09520 [Mesonia sp.]|uniref:hypothetical protein n=1 Tax=Mesonia sp. TaxID=1960830 RepID=UPI003241CDE6